MSFVLISREKVLS